MLVAAQALALFFVGIARAEDYPGAKIVDVGKGQIVFEDKDGKKQNFYFSPTMKMLDDKGAEQDKITGLRFLLKDNIVDVKTTVDKKKRQEFISEIKFVSGKVAELPKTGSKINLRPDPNFKGMVTEIRNADPVWQAYIGTAKVGDFKEYKGGNEQEPGRWETVEVGKDYAIIAKVDYMFGKRMELRMKQMLPKGVKAASTPLKKGKDEITVGDKKVICMKKGDAKAATWTSPEVPFDGVVKVESRNYRYIVTDFGRGQ
jgi:hypothetical protein